jgi:REP element-mobilizing transposase RayT
MAIAFFSTWTTYGTWLPGDERGWFKRGEYAFLKNEIARYQASMKMTDTAITLDTVQRSIVEKTIIEHCLVRDWLLHAVNCRTNHVHVVVTAPERPIEMPREQFKAWCTRKLKQMNRFRKEWWTQRGWDVYIDNEDDLHEVIRYVVEGQ